MVTDAVLLKMEELFIAGLKTFLNKDRKDLLVLDVVLK